MPEKNTDETQWPRVPKTGSVFAPEPQPPPVNSMMERCQGCPYPQHGVICWHQDGSCLRTDMQKILEKSDKQK